MVPKLLFVFEVAKANDTLDLLFLQGAKLFLPFEFPFVSMIRLHVRSQVPFVLEAPVAVQALVRFLNLGRDVYEAGGAATGLRLGYVYNCGNSGFGFLVGDHGS